MNLLPETSEKAALALEWFPTRWQAVLWRNWGVVPIDRLCAVLGADESTLRAAAGDMGLDPKLDADVAHARLPYHHPRQLAPLLV